MPVLLVDTLVNIRCSHQLYWWFCSHIPWLTHQCTTSVWPISMVNILKNRLQKYQHSWVIHWCTTTRPRITKPPIRLAHTLMYQWCTTTTVGWYIGLGITKLPVRLAHTSVYEQCTTNTVGSYIGPRITKLPVQLAYTLMYDRCTTNTVGLYTGPWITKTCMTGSVGIYNWCTIDMIGIIGSYIGLCPMKWVSLNTF